MRARAMLVAVVGLTACDRVFSLDRPPIDAPIPVTITGTLSRTYVHNDAGGAPTTTSVIPEAPTARVDGVEVELTWDAATGAFSFVGYEDGTWSVRTGSTEMFSRARELELMDVVYGRPDQVLVAPGAKLSFTVTAPTVDTFVNIDTTGVWSSQQPMNTSSNTFTVDWATTTGFQGAPGTIDGDRNDELIVAWFKAVGDNALAYSVMTHARRMRYRQVPAGTTIMSGSLDLLTNDQCLDIDGRFADLIATLSAAFPGGNSPVAAWVLSAVPYTRFGTSVALPIAIAQGTANVRHTIRFDDPFVGLEQMLTVSAVVFRTVAGRVLNNAISYYSRPPIQATCTAPPEIATTTAPIPIRPRLGGVLLADGVTVGLTPDERAELTWENRSETVADAYSITLGEVVSTGEPRVIRRYWSAEPRIVIDAEDLPSGSYQFDIRARTGMPKAATGGYAEQTYPFTIGLVRAVFSVSREP